jgi:hypothetical protein
MVVRIRSGIIPFIIGAWILGIQGMSAAWAQDRAHPPDNAPQVFQPDEIQHGFSEFDSLQDLLFDDNIPAPYDSYSQDPEIPLSDHRPGGLFEALNFSESVEDEDTLRKGHLLVPVNPTETFPEETKAVYLTFSVFKHYAPYQVIGQLFPEEVAGLDAKTQLDEDIAELATEDDSGYLKFFPQAGKWMPGRYRVDLYVGYMAKSYNKMGAMRFTILPHSESSSAQP